MIYFVNYFLIIFCSAGFYNISKDLDEIKKKLGIEPRPKKKLFDFRKKGDK